MGLTKQALTAKHLVFIKQQHIFFLATADNGDTKINMSPKGLDSLRIINNKSIAILSKIGSGNETAAHIQYNPRITIMFCSFDLKPLILRIYGKALEIRKNNQQFNKLLTLFDDTTGVRQIFRINIELVKESCGFGVPYFEFKSQRKLLNNWLNVNKKNLDEYIYKNNTKSLDNKTIQID